MRLAACTAEDAAVRMTGFDGLAVRERLIAVYPDGTAARNGGPGSYVERRSLLCQGNGRQC